MITPRSLQQGSLEWLDSGIAGWLTHFSLQSNLPDRDVKNTFRHASVVGNNRVVFNVKGNDSRIVCTMDYPRHVMYIKFVGTHTEYDAVDVEEVE